MHARDVAGSPGDGEPNAPSAIVDVVRLVPALSHRTLKDLERLLAARLAEPTPAQRREARIGLLMELIEDTGEVPGAAHYDAARRKRQSVGEIWPSRATLNTIYGDWFTTCDAAMRLVFEGGPPYCREGQHGARFAAAYTRGEIVAAITRFRSDYGAWPTSTQWVMWSQNLRRLARRGGHPDPRIPSMKPIRRRFGTYQRAVDVARRA